MTIQDKVTIVSSVALRTLSYVFLRWIPGHPFPPLIYALFAIYIPAFISSFLTQPQYNVLYDEIDVIVADHLVEDHPPNLASTAAHSRSIPSNGKSEHLEKEVEIEETIVVQKRSARLLKTLLTGLPSPTSALLSLLTLLVNIGLVLAVTDLVYRGKIQFPGDDLAFARVGYVSDSEAKLLIREPDESKWPVRVEVRIKDAQPSFDLPAWRDMGSISVFTNDTDYTAVLTLNLRQGISAAYEYRTSSAHVGSFRSGPQPGRKYFEKRDSKLCFVTSSCIIPNFPYNPAAHPLAIPGFRDLGKLLPSLKSHFMLFLGDFIYADVPKRFGTAIEDFRQKYRQIYSSPDWPLVSNLSWIHVLDDHEISNDYDKGPNTQVFKAASDPFNHYHVAPNPPSVGHHATWFEFESGPATFFMMDTRKYRDLNHGSPANSTHKSMLGQAQLSDLLAFLARPLPKGVRWKIVASSIPFTQNWGGPSKMDTWAGYLDERQRILEAMWDAALNAGVVVLSGDRHEFAATAFPPPAGGRWPSSATVTEFSTSPLSQFYLPIPTYKQTDMDIMLKYLPHGNSKFGAIDIDVPERSDISTLRFRLSVDGEEAWETTLLSPSEEKGFGDRLRDTLRNIKG